MDFLGRNQILEIFHPLQNNPPLFSDLMDSMEMRLYLQVYVKIRRKKTQPVQKQGPKHEKETL